MMDASLDDFLPTRRTTYWEHESLGLPMWTTTGSFQQEVGQGIEESYYIVLQNNAITNPILNFK